MPRKIRSKRFLVLNKDKKSKRRVLKVKNGGGYGKKKTLRKRNIGPRPIGSLRRRKK